MRNKIIAPHNPVEMEQSAFLWEIRTSVHVLLDSQEHLVWKIWMNASRNLVGMANALTHMEATRK